MFKFFMKISMKFALLASGIENDCSLIRKTIVQSVPEP
jgi:hypothetical protein